MVWRVLVLHYPPKHISGIVHAARELGRRAHVEQRRATGQQPEQPATGPEAPAPEAPVVAPRGPKPKLLLLPTESVEGKVTSLVSERIDEQTRRRLREGNRVVLMPSYAEIRKQLAGQGMASAAIVQAEQEYTAGIGLLTAGENQKALEKFQRAVEMMEQNLPDLRNYNVLSDALANLALAYFLSGYDLDGRKTMKSFAQLKPDATLNPEKYPPELIEVYRDELAKVKRLALAS